MEKVSFFNNEKFKHLRDASLRIQICKEAYVDHRDEQFKKKIEEYKNNSQNIRYRASYEYNKVNNILSNREGNYSISEINEKNKFSDNYINCTGVVLVGIDKETGENISLLTQEESGENMEDKLFLNDLSNRIEEFISMCEPKTIDALIVGGNDNNDNLEEYENSVKILRDKISPLLDFYPDVATYPKLTSFDTKVFFKY